MSNVEALLAVWRRRAADRVASAVRVGRTTMEGRVLLADAAAIRQCAEELREALRDSDG